MVIAGINVQVFPFTERKEGAGWRDYYTIGQVLTTPYHIIAYLYAHIY